MNDQEREAAEALYEAARDEPGERAPMPPSLDDMTGPELVTEVLVRELSAQEASTDLYVAQQALITRMKDNGATVLATEVGMAKLKTDYSYDQGILHGLLELVPEERLVAAGAYVAEHTVTETVPAKWNATKAKPFAEEGKEIADVIERAKTEGRTSVKIEQPKLAPADQEQVTA
jgi:hypothetical protein